MRRGLALVTGFGLAACGRIGFGTTDDAGGVIDADAPVDAVFVPAVPCNCTHVSAGASHTCARLASGALRCWGENFQGQLGYADPADQLVPVPVTEITDAVDVVAGGNHTCARGASAVSCWGMDVNGQLGNGAAAGGSTPSTMSGVTSPELLTASRWHTCIVRATGDAACCGLNDHGQLADGTSSGNRATPVAVVGLAAPATSAAAGEYFSCFATTAGQAQCAGENLYGQLGNNTMIDSADLQDVMGEGDVAQVVAGRYHACARTSGGAVLCWGRNQSGQLGDGTTMDRKVATAVVELTDAVDITAGQSHTWCWGANNSGELGIGSTSTTGRPVPTQVPYLREVTDIDAGDSHTCAIAAGGLYCWGSNGNGQLGDGTMRSATSPVAVVVPS